MLLSSCCPSAGLRCSTTCALSTKGSSSSSLTTPFAFATPFACAVTCLAAAAAEGTAAATEGTAAAAEGTTAATTEGTATATEGAAAATAEGATTTTTAEGVATASESAVAPAERRRLLPCNSLAATEGVAATAAKSVPSAEGTSACRCPTEAGRSSKGTALCLLRLALRMEELAVGTVASLAKAAYLLTLATTALAAFSTALATTASSSAARVHIEVHAAVRLRLEPTLLGWKPALSLRFTAATTER